MFVRLSFVAMVLGCTSTADLVETFIEPLEEQVGDRNNPAEGSIEARLAALEGASGPDLTQLQSQLAALAQRVDALESIVDVLSERDVDNLEIWIPGEHPTRTVSPSVLTLPGPTQARAALTLSYAACDVILLEVLISSNNDSAAIELAVDGSTPNTLRVQTLALGASPVDLRSQVWLRTGRGSRFFARTAPGQTVATTASFQHIGCLSYAN
jgi:hypothetical protein